MLNKYKELELSLSNPEVLQQISNEQMMHSVTRRISDSSEEKANKDDDRTVYPKPRENELMRGTKHPNPTGV